MPVDKSSPTAPKSGKRYPYNVFVSSTYLDNKERRRLVQEAITTAGMRWHGMELFAASTRPTVEECVRHVQESDVLVGIIARRYGWIPENSATSITELEYDAAQDRLMFELDASQPFNEEDFDPGPDRWDKQKKLDAFKQRIRKDQMPATFTETTLHGKVIDTLNKWREGREGSLEQPSPERSETPGRITHDDFDEEIRRYCRKAETLHARLPVAGFATQLKVPHRHRGDLRAPACHAGPAGCGG